MAQTPVSTKQKLCSILLIIFMSIFVLYQNRAFFALCHLFWCFIVTSVLFLLYSVPLLLFLLSVIFWTKCFCMFCYFLGTFRFLIPFSGDSTIVSFKIYVKTDQRKVQIQNLISNVGHYYDNGSFPKTPPTNPHRWGFWENAKIFPKTPARDHWHSSEDFWDYLIRSFPKTQIDWWNDYSK